MVKKIYAQLYKRNDMWLKKLNVLADYITMQSEILGKACTPENIV